MEGEGEAKQKSLYAKAYRLFLSKGTTFHTLRREKKNRKHNMRCLFPLFFA